jgi:CHAT domain-containing protein
MAVRETEWRALYGLARLALSAGDRKQAEAHLFEAIEGIERMRAEIRIEQLKENFLDNKRDVYETLVKLLADDGRIEAAFNTAERSRARNFMDILGSQPIRLSDVADTRLLERVKRLKNRIAEHEALVAQAENETEKTTYREELARLVAEHRDLMLEIRVQNPQLNTLVSVSPLSAEKVVSLLDSGTAILAYYLLDREILCWRMRPGEIRLFRVPFGRETLSRDILEYRRMTQNLEPLEDPSRELYNRLLAPVLSKEAEIERLCIIPHRSLHYLSFGTLFSGSDYLIDRYSLFYLPSASLLSFTKARRLDRKNPSVLAVGNPELGDPVFELPFSQYEVGSIRWNFPNITLLTEEKATEAWVVNNINQFGVVHMATHGEFDPIRPLFSAVHLAKGEEHDGHLEAREVFSLPLSADMVFLSACQTGLGKVTAGDDVVGLNRAFLYAGTHTIISSLWRVSDVSTAILVKHFYRRYVNRDKADSLRLAALHVKEMYPHPGYWGAFTLVGDFF